MARRPSAFRRFSVAMKNLMQKAPRTLPSFGSRLLSRIAVVACAACGLRPRLVGPMLAVTRLLGMVMMIGVAAGCSAHCPDDCGTPVTAAYCASQQNDQCKLGGSCGFKPQDCDSGNCAYCIADSDEHCRNAEICRLSGDCSLFGSTSTGTACAPGSDKDCAASVNCKEKGQCVRVKDSQGFPRCATQP